MTTRVKMIQYLSMTFAALLLLVQPAFAAEQYVDVHVHLRGTTRSGMLGNLNNKPRMGGHKGVRQTPHNDRQSFMRNGRQPGWHGSQNSREENLKIAASYLIQKMDKFRVRQALVVVVPGPNPDEEDEYLSMRKVVGEYPDRLKLLAGGERLSPFLQNISPEKVTDADRKRFRQIATQILNDGAVGFGEMISYHLSMANHHSFQYAPPDHPLFLLLADIAAQHNVPVDLHMEAIVRSRPIPDNLQRASANNPKTLESTIPALERLLEHNRKAKIVWQHIGWDNTGDMTPQLLDRLLSTHSNLNIALRVERRTQQVGNGPRMPNRLVGENGKLKPDWLALIMKFSNRVTIGSDEFFFPVTSERPNQSFNETWSLLSQLPQELRHKIGNENPRRIYNLQ